MNTPKHRPEIPHLSHSHSFTLLNISMYLSYDVVGQIGRPKHFGGFENGYLSRFFHITAQKQVAKVSRFCIGYIYFLHVFLFVYSLCELYVSTLFFGCTKKMSQMWPREHHPSFSSLFRLRGTGFTLGYYISKGHRFMNEQRIWNLRLCRDQRKARLYIMGK